MGNIVKRTVGLVLLILYSIAAIAYTIILIWDFPLWVDGIYGDRSFGWVAASVLGALVLSECPGKLVNLWEDWRHPERRVEQQRINAYHDTIREYWQSGRTDDPLLERHLKSLGFKHR